MLLGTASIEAVSITKNVIRSVMEILRATGFVPVVGAFDSFFPSSKPATPLRDSSFEIQREIKNTATLERQTLTAARVCNSGQLRYPTLRDITEEEENIISTNIVPVTRSWSSVCPNDIERELKRERGFFNVFLSFFRNYTRNVDRRVIRWRSKEKEHHFSSRFSSSFPIEQKILDIFDLSRI